MEDAVTDFNELAIKVFIQRLKNINAIIEEQYKKSFDGKHCVFCGEEILPRERVTECQKIYCKKCADKLFRF